MAVVTSPAHLHTLYQRHLGREADPSGLNAFAGREEDEIVASLIGSREHAANRVGAAYADLLGRAPDPEGADHWTNWVMQTGDNPDNLRFMLMQTPEYQARQSAAPRPAPAPASIDHSLLAQLAELEQAARENASLTQSRLMELYSNRTLPDMAAGYAGKGMFHSGESRVAADRARQDVDTQVADTQRMLQTTLADLARQRALASAGVRL